MLIRTPQYPSIFRGKEMFYIILIFYLVLSFCSLQLFVKPQQYTLSQ